MLKVPAGQSRQALAPVSEKVPPLQTRHCRTEGSGPCEISNAVGEKVTGGQSGSDDWLSMS